MLAVEDTSAFIGVRPRLKSFFAPGPPRKAEPQMNADGVRAVRIALTQNRVPRYL
jgi:hypothetical protein